ncbi:putative ribonuclease H-like domain-containing protein [Tanacetum coccineum]
MCTQSVRDVDVYRVGVASRFPHPTIPITVEETLAQRLMEIKAAKPKAKGIVFHDQEEQVSIFKPTVSITQPSVKDKGKGIMQDPERPLTKKDQVAIDEDLARNIQAYLGDYQRVNDAVRRVRHLLEAMAQENGTSITKMSIHVTAKEKTNKKNDVKARSLLVMALPNEHQLTFIQYPDAKTMFAAIETRFRGNAATKKTQKTLLKQQHGNFSASSVESLDSIFNRLQKIVSRLAILGVVIAQEDLNSKFLSSLPPEWNTHVVVWMKKPEIETMSIDDLCNKFKIVEQKVKKSVGASSGAQNLAFMTAPSTSSTNDANTPSPQVSTASFSDNVVYAFMVENPNGFNLLHQDLEQIHEDDLEVMDLKWQLSLLSMRAKRYYQRTGKKIFINAKSKVECFNCHKIGHFARECRAPRSKEVLKREVACKDYEINVLKSKFEKVKQEKEGIEFKIEKFDKASKDLDKLLESQITDKSKKGLGYSAVPPPHPLIYNRPKNLDLSYFGLDEFKEPEFKGYGTQDSKKESNVVCDKKSDEYKENSDNSLVKEQVSKDTSSFVESSLNVDK